MARQGIGQETEFFKVISFRTEGKANTITKQNKAGHAVGSYAYLYIILF